MKVDIADIDADLIEAAVKVVVRRHQLREVLKFAGTVAWEGDLAEWRTDDLPPKWSPAKEFDK
ncbi:MAG TPA: hypothetical protein VG317_19210 [Pseudonocardiaceae bacterium]|jgi:hypothetical protein|nr:hypothetical protein [Pseudonocardiaceae bacterium]